MPEVEGIEKGIEDYYKKIAEEFSNEKPDIDKIKKVAKEKADKINLIMNKEISLDTGGIVKSNKKFTLKKYDPKDDKMVFKDSSGKVFETTFSKFEKENPSVFNSSPTSDTMPEGDDTYIIKNSEGEEFKIEKLYPEGAEKYSPAGFSKNLWQSYIKLKGKQKWIKGPSGGKKAMFDFIKDQAKSHNATITNAGIEKESEKEKKSTVDESINKFKIKRQLEDDLINSKPVKQSILDMFPDIKKKWEGRAKIEPEDQKPSATEALKDELGKKKGESKEREITVFGKQQKVKTKPIELNLGYEHPFEIAKRDFGNNRSDWVILESSTGLRVGDGKTQKDAIENAETKIKKYTKSESEFKQLVENNMSKS